MTSRTDPIRVAILTAGQLAISLIAMWTALALLAHADDPMEHWDVSSQYTVNEGIGAPDEAGEADLVQHGAFVRDCGQAATGRRPTTVKLTAATVGYSVGRDELIVEADDSAAVPQRAEHPPYRATPPPRAQSASA